MAPSPAAGKAPKLPTTPTKAGETATKKTPRSAPKLATKSKENTPAPESPKLPSKEDVESKKDDAEEATGQKIGLEDNDPSEDLEEAQGKVSQAGNETGAESSVADLDEAAPEPLDDDEDTVGGAKETVEDTTGDIGDSDADEEDDADEEAEDTPAESTQSKAKGLAGKASGAAGKGLGALGKGAKGLSKGDPAGAADDTVGDVKETAEDTAEDAQDTVEDTAEDAQETAEGAVDDTKETAEDAADVDGVEGVDGVKDTAEDAVEGAQDTAGEAADTVEETAEDAQDTAEGAVDEAKDTADLELPDVSSTFKGLEVGDDGKILKDGEPIGEVTEGNWEDLVGAEIGDDGEILDEDGDLIGRVGFLPGAAESLAQKAQETAEDAADQVETYLPELNVLDGLEVGEGGQIKDADGKVLGEIVEGDPEDLIGQTINAEGEVLDEDGDVIGRAKTLPQEVEKAQEEVEGAGVDLPDIEALKEQLTPDVTILEGKRINKKGKILDEEGEVIGQLAEGSDPATCAGKSANAQGLILNDDGDIIGKVEVVPGEAADEAMKSLNPELVEEIEQAQQQIDEAGEQAGDAVDDAQDQVEEAAPELPDLDILEGLKVNKKGEVLNEDGEPIARLTEGELADVAGKKLNANGEILDKDGNVIGKVELIAEAFDVPDVEDAAPKLPGLDILEGLKVNKKGEVLNEDGEPIAKLVEGELADVAGKKINENGEVLDKDGNVIGKVELIPEAFADLAEDAAGAAEDAADEAKDAAEEAADALPDLSILDGRKVNKKGEVLDEDGEVIAKLSEGELSDVAGKTINEKGEILDEDGNVIGKMELVGAALEEATGGADLSKLEGLKVNKKGEVLDEDGEVIAKLADGELDDVAGKKINEKGEILDADGEVIGNVNLLEDSGLPPLSVLQGLKCNKFGKIVDNEGRPVGELIEGDPKKISKAGLTCDAQGQFWDQHGKVIGRAQTIEVEEDEDAPFSGLEGLIVVKDGFVEDENGNKVGKLVEGDAKKLVGRAVDEDGDVIDKRGNVVGHAERYEEEEPEPEVEEKADLSILKGLTCNKQGNVIGPEGVPIARLVEGNPKELAGKKIDGEGQIWNDSGAVIGRCELIPADQREAKPEGPFAGLEGLVVVKDGWVEDEEGNRVGQVVDGDPKKLIGRAVDEDGDIIDKYGNVKGHAEPWEEEEVAPEDLSRLAGMTVNKQGNVVDEHGTIFGRIASGDPKALAGRKVDGEGKIWSDDGKVIGQAELIPGGERPKAEGPFSGFESLTITKEGTVVDGAGQIVGRIIEGDILKLQGRHVDEDGDVSDKNGNTIGKAERWTPEEKKRDINPMSGRKVNKDGEVRDADGNLIGKLTAGDLKTLIGKEIDDNGYVVDNDGNKIGECTLIENLPDEEPEGPSPEELEAQKKEEEDRELAKKMGSILTQTIERIEPILKMITEHTEKADRTPKDELDEEQLVSDVKPLIEEGGRILQECNGAIRGLDPDGRIAANAKARAAAHEASPEEYHLAEQLKDLTSRVVTTIDGARKRISDMPHAKKKLNPLWGLLTEPLFQIIAAVGLLLAGVLGLVGRLLNGLGLGGLVNGLLGGLGIDKLLGGLGLGSITESLGLGGGKKKK